MSCEVYDIKENKWSFISSYNTLLGNSLYSFSSAMAVSSSGGVAGPIPGMGSLTP